MQHDRKAFELDAAIEEVREDVRPAFARIFKEHAEIARIKEALMNLLEVCLEILRTRLRRLGLSEPA
jgi:galactose-1-phosphate uridylyltransferase